MHAKCPFLRYSLIHVRSLFVCKNNGLHWSSKSKFVARTSIRIRQATKSLSRWFPRNKNIISIRFLIELACYSNATWLRPLSR